MTIANIVKHKKFQLLIAIAGSIVIGLTIYDSILSIKLSKMELKNTSNDDNES